MPESPPGFATMSGPSLLFFGVPGSGAGLSLSPACRSRVEVRVSVMGFILSGAGIAAPNFVGIAISILWRPDSIRHKIMGSGRGQDSSGVFRDEHRHPTPPELVEGAVSVSLDSPSGKIVTVLEILRSCGAGPVKSLPRRRAPGILDPVEQFAGRRNHLQPFQCDGEGPCGHDTNIRAEVHPHDAGVLEQNQARGIARERVTEFVGQFPDRILASALDSAASAKASPFRFRRILKNLPVQL